MHCELTNIFLSASNVSIIMQADEPTLNDYITEDERQHFLLGLHRFLIWVGEKLPEDVEVNGRKVSLRDLIWACIHQREFSDKERKYFLDIIHFLETKEKYNEEMLHKANLTRDEAKRLYRDSAGLIRAIIDLRECESGKVKLKEGTEDIKRKVSDAKRWLGFLKNVGKK